MQSLTRRIFLKTATIASVAPILGSEALNQPTLANEAQNVVPSKATRWYKGQLHTHSQWSDGSGMPESVVAIYKEGGYEFFCLSDHNGFQTDTLKFTGFGYSDTPSDTTPFEGETSTWKHISDKKGWAKLTEADVKQAQEKFGADSVAIKTVCDEKYVRLKTFAELQAQFEEPERFLLVPGFEQTGSSKDGMQVHMNFINVTDSFPYIQKADPVETVYENLVEGEKKYAENKEPYLFTLNHPQWPYYDISPEVLKKLDCVRFFELTNNPRSGGPTIPEAWDPEKYWDAVNAYRIANKKQVLLATGSDDAHTLAPRQGMTGPFLGWNMVRAEELSTNAIMSAMNCGDFYVSSGVTLKDVQFCKDSGTLTVEVDASAEDGVKIEFIGTKKTYDRNVETITSDAPKRTIDVYPACVGMVLKTVEGVSGSYTLQPDDLYVRARVSIAKSEQRYDKYEILIPCAWTQPYHV